MITAGRRSALAAVLTLAFVLGAAPAASEILEVDLSERVVSITTGFTGSKVLLFGTSGGEGDVIVVVRGPASRAVVRRKGRIAGVWINRDRVVFNGVPAFYAIAASRRVADILPETVIRREQIGASNLRLVAESPATAEEAKIYGAALVRNQARLGLYPPETAPVTFLPSRRLFKTEIKFPANVPTGDYAIQVYLVRNGEVVKAESSGLTVQKAGLEWWIFDKAHRFSALYGLIAIVLALVAGWAAGEIFRRT